MSNVNILKPQYWSNFNSIATFHTIERAPLDSLRLHFVGTTMKVHILRFIHQRLTAALCGNQSSFICNDAKSVPVHDKEASANVFYSFFICNRIIWMRFVRIVSSFILLTVIKNLIKKCQKHYEIALFVMRFHTFFSRWIFN